MFAVIFALILMLVVILLDVGGKFMSWAFSFFTTGNGFLPILGDATDFSAMPVSYTHLDVYKRQVKFVSIASRSSCRTPYRDAWIKIA